MNENDKKELNTLIDERIKKYLNKQNKSSDKIDRVDDWDIFKLKAKAQEQIDSITYKEDNFGNDYNDKKLIMTVTEKYEKSKEELYNFIDRKFKHDGSSKELIELLDNYLDARDIKKCDDLEQLHDKLFGKTPTIAFNKK